LAARAFLGLIALSVFATGARGAQVVKGPYLIFPGDKTQMQVLWQLDVAASGTLRWGADTACSDGSAMPHSSGDRLFAHTITGLTPDSKYYYRLEAGTASLTGSFRTAPPDNGQRAKFFAFGDTRTNLAPLNAVTGAMVAAFQADPACQTFVLHVGDWVDADTEDFWATRFFDPSGTRTAALVANLPVLGCMGNHEGAGVIYRKYWPYPYVASRYWSFDYGPAHVVVVDQYDAAGGPSDAQVDWIRGDLASTAKKWKFLLFHEPAWTAGVHPNNTRAQQALQPLCETYGVDVCFAGHNHYYARCVVNGVHHVTTGAGGAPLYTPVPGQPYLVTSAKEYEYCKIEIDGNRLTLEALTPDGTVLDSFAITHPEPARARWWRLLSWQEDR
jgi:predicted phosphodiesterase